MSDLPTIHEQAPYLSVEQIKNIPSIVQNGYYDTLEFLDNLFYPLKWLASTFAWILGGCYSTPIYVFSLILNEFYKLSVALLQISYIVTYSIGSIMESHPYKEETAIHYRNQKGIEDAMKPLKIPFNQLGLLLFNLRNVVSYLARFVLGSVYSIALHIISIPVTPVYLLSLGMINLIMKPTLNLFKTALVQLGSTLGIYSLETRIRLSSPSRNPKKRLSRIDRLRALIAQPNDVHKQKVVIDMEHLNIQSDSGDRPYLAPFVEMVGKYFGEHLEDRLSEYNKQQSVPKLQLTKRIGDNYNPLFISSKVLAEIRSNDLTSELKRLLSQRLVKNVETINKLADSVVYLVQDAISRISDLEGTERESTINLLGIHGSPGSNTQELAGITDWCGKIQDVSEGQNYPPLSAGDDELDKAEVVDQLLDVMINTSWILNLAAHYNSVQIANMEVQSQFSSAPASPPRPLVTSPVRSDQFSRQATSKPTEGNLITKAWGSISSVFSQGDNQPTNVGSYTGR